MIKFDGEFDDEACELGARYLSDNEGLALDEFIEKYASQGLKREISHIDELYAQVRAEGCR